MDFQDSRQRFFAGLLVCTAVGGVGWLLLKWWVRPPTVEFQNLKYIQLLTTAVSSRRIDMVDKVETAVRQRFAAGQMSEQELKHFQDLFTLARDGEWEQADRKCFEFAEAQLSRSRAKPDRGGHSHDHSHDRQ